MLKEKDDAVRIQDLDRAGELRDREMELRQQIQAIAQSKTSSTHGEGEDSPIVTEEDIAQIVVSMLYQFLDSPSEALPSQHSAVITLLSKACDSDRLTAILLGECLWMITNESAV